MSRKKHVSEQPTKNKIQEQSILYQPNSCRQQTRNLLEGKESTQMKEKRRFQNVFNLEHM